MGCEGEKFNFVKPKKLVLSFSHVLEHPSDHLLTSENAAGPKTCRKKEISALSSKTGRAVTRRAEGRVGGRSRGDQGAERGAVRGERAGEAEGILQWQGTVGSATKHQRLSAPSTGPTQTSPTSPG